MPELKQAKQVERNQREERRHHADHHGRLQLKAPAQLLARRAQGQHPSAQGQEAQHHAPGVSHARQAVRTVGAAVLGKAQQFDGQHGQHARHEVEDQTAHKGSQQRQDKADEPVHAQQVCEALRLFAIGRQCNRGRFGCGQFRHGRPSLSDGRRHRKPLALSPFARGEQKAHLLGVSQAQMAEWQLYRPHIALPRLAGAWVLLGGRCHQFGRVWKHLQGFALQRCGQAADLQHHVLCFKTGRGFDAGPRFGLLSQQGFKRCRVGRKAAVGWNAQGKVALLRNALKATHQPVGVHLKVQRWRGVGLELLGHGEWHSQQHGFLEAVVGQVARFELVRQGEQHIARGDAGRQIEFELCGQPRVARIAPIGVPFGLVRELQAHPERLARLHTLRCMGQQLST